MNVTGAGFVVALRAAGVVRVLDVLGDLIGPVVRGGQTMEWTAGSIERGWPEDDIPTPAADER